MKRFVAALLALLMLLPSCGNGTADDSAEKGAEKEIQADPGLVDGAGEEKDPAEEAIETETSRADRPDTLDPSLDFDGTQINALTFGRGVCQKYDVFGELNGDVVLDAIYNRNITVEDRLNVKFNFVAGSDDWERFPSEVMLVIKAGSDDYDFIMEEACRLFQQSISGGFYDLLTVNHLDPGQPWWYQSMMEESQLDNKKRFFLVGDICLSVLLGATAMYFDKPMFKDYFGDPDALYNTVLEGKWTYDLFDDYCGRVYTDVNGNGETDDGDITGFRYTLALLNYFSMSNGLTYSKRDEEGFPILDIYNENSLKWAETLYHLAFAGNCCVEGNLNGAFTGRKALFLPGFFETAHQLREVDFEYGILPYPKLDESVDYMSGGAVVNGCGVAVPVSANPGKLDATAASMEALCAEGYRRVVTAWYDTALKFKYSDATIDSRMVDIVYEHITCPFIIMADKALNTGSIFMASLGSATAPSAFATWYAANEKSLESKLEKAIEKYKNLQ